jgi:hypothetical protein
MNVTMRKMGTPPALKLSEWLVIYPMQETKVAFWR